MKRSTVISLLCALIASIVVIIGVMIGLVATGVFGVEQKSLIITSGSSTAVYDGTPLMDSEWHLTQGELQEGHTLSVNVTGSQLNVGMSENYLTATVYDASGVDVSSDYTIECHPGVLNVKSRDIYITADSDMKQYDGEPLTRDSYTLQSKLDLVANHVLNVTVEGSQTEVGTADNVISEVVIATKAGEDVTKNYNVTTKKGKLIVYSEDTLVIQTADDAKEYDGTALTNSNWELISGELQPNHHLEVEVTGSKVSVGEAKNTFEVKVLDGEGKDVTKEYHILSVPGTLTVIPRDLIVKTKDATKVYDGTPLTENGYTLSPSFFEGLISLEGLVVTGSQTEVGSSENSVDETLDYKVVTGDGRDLTANFKLIFEYGVLEVTATPPVTDPLVFESSSAEKTFDGQPLTNPICTLKSGSLLEGHKAVAVATSEITNVGFCDNEFTVKILDANYKDVTSQYKITKEPGTLQVFPLEVVITSASAQKVYDGEPLTSSGYLLEPAHIEKLFSFQVDIIGSRIDPGTSPNTIASVKVYDTFREEITQNFIFKKQEGELVVVEAEEKLKTELIYQSATDAKDYDGTPLTNSGCELISGELPDGYTADIQVTGSITDYGRTDNVFTVVIRDPDGYDVTEDEFLVVRKFGTLQIFKKSITVVAKSDEKEYDGTPLTNSDYVVMNSDPSDSSQPLVDGDKLQVEVVGSITDIGMAPNAILSAFVIGKDGMPSNNYDIDVENGILAVLPEGDNERLTSGGDMTGRDDKYDDVVMFTVTAKDGDANNIYLKLDSYGKFNNAENSWELAPKYTTFTSEGLTAHYLTAIAHRDAGKGTKTLEIVPTAGGFALPYYSITDTSGVVVEDDAVILKTYLNKYEVEYYEYDPKVTLSSEYSNYEQVYRKFVYDNYKGKDSIDAATYAYFESGAINMARFKDGDKVLVSEVVDYIRSFAEYTKDYPESIDTSDAPIVEFFKEEKGVCRHFASAATMLFRYLGVPARYTVGYLVGNVSEGETVDVKGKDCHAWVEVYYPNCGWVSLEVTGGFGSGGGGGDFEGGEKGDLNGPFKDLLISGGMTQNSTAFDEDTFFIVQPTKGNLVDGLLRMTSFGNFDSDSNAWLNGPAYTTLYNYQYSANYLASWTHGNTGLSPNAMTIIPVGGGYAMPYFMANDTTDLIFADDLSTSASYEDGYDVSYYGYQPNAVLPTRYSAYEQAYREFVYNNYTGRENIDPATYEYFGSGAIDMSGFVDGDKVLVSKVVEFIKNYATYNAEYPDSLNTSKTPIVEFFNVKEGVCKHYATAATMLFRYLGVPARYTVGFSVGNVSEGDTVTVLGKQCHAWVELYFDNYGWVPFDVTGGSNGGDESEQYTTIKATITPNHVRKEYENGVTVSVGDISGISGFDTYLANGYKCEYVLGLKGTDKLVAPGKTSSYVSEFRIYDSEDTLIYEMKDGEEKNYFEGKYIFEMKYNQGIAQLYRDIVIVRSSSISKIYDGLAIGGDIADFTWGGNLMSGHKVELSDPSSIVDASKVKYECAVKVVDANGNNVSDEYWINGGFGYLEITRRSITVTTGGATKVFDIMSPTPLVNNSITYDVYSDYDSEEKGLASTDAIRDGDWAVGPKYPVITGSGENLLTKLKITSKDDPTKDVTSNYAITVVKGMLTVEMPEDMTQ